MSSYARGLAQRSAWAGGKDGGRARKSGAQIRRGTPHCDWEPFAGAVSVSRRSIHFSHRVYWFLAAFAPDNAYSSPICGAIRGGLLGQSQLMRAVEVQGALASRRLLRLGPIEGGDVLPDTSRLRQVRSLGFAGRAQQAGTFVSQAGRAALRAARGLVTSARDFVSTAPEGAAAAMSDSPEGAYSSPTLGEPASPATSPTKGPKGAAVASHAPGAAHSATGRPPKSATGRAAAGRTAPVAPGAAASAPTPAASQAVPGPAAPAPATTMPPGAVESPLVRALATPPRSSASSTPVSAAAAAAAASTGGGGEGPTFPPPAALGPPAIAADGGLPASSAAIMTSPERIGGPSPDEAEVFLEMIAFCSELLQIGDSLIEDDPVRDRNTRLRALLSRLNARFLPSRSGALYLPVGNNHNRLLAIHPDRSFCFRTKERVPYMLVVECTDYATASGRPIDLPSADDGADSDDVSDFDSDSGGDVDSEQGRRSGVQQRMGRAIGGAVTTLRNIVRPGQSQQSIPFSTSADVPHGAGGPGRGDGGAPGAGGTGAGAAGARDAGGRSHRVHRRGSRAEAEEGAYGAMGDSDDAPGSNPAAGVEVGSAAAGAAAIDAAAASSKAGAGVAGDSKRRRGASISKHGLLPTDSAGTTDCEDHAAPLTAAPAAGDVGGRASLGIAADGRAPGAGAGAVGAGRAAGAAGDGAADDAGAFGAGEGDPTDLGQWGQQGGLTPVFEDDAARKEERRRRRERLRKAKSGQAASPGTASSRALGGGAPPPAGGSTRRGLASTADADRTDPVPPPPAPGSREYRQAMSYAAAAAAGAAVDAPTAAAGGPQPKHGAASGAVGTAVTNPLSVVTSGDLPAVYRTRRAGSDAGIEPRVEGLMDSVRAEAGRRRGAAAGGAAAASAAGARGARSWRGLQPSAEDRAVDDELAAGMEAFHEDPSLTDLEDAPGRRGPAGAAAVSGPASAAATGAAASAASGAAHSGGQSSAGDAESKASAPRRPPRAAASARAGPASAAGGLSTKPDATDEAVAVAFRQPWNSVVDEVRAASPFGHLPGWRLVPVIVKSNDDLRQEQFVSVLLKQFELIWRDADVPVWVRHYDILATARDGGIIEAIPDTISIDSLRKGLGERYGGLQDFYVRHWGAGRKDSPRFRAARKAFVSSMAAYAIVCYLLNIKDRHNGNILIDRHGHVMHIDFGFLLSNSPGGNMNFEAAPFKLTKEFVDLMGGARSRSFVAFRNLCAKAFLEVRKRKEKVILLVEMMMDGNEDLPCFRAGKRAIIEQLRARFAPGASSRQCVSLVNGLINQSMDNWRTRWYDAYQRWSVGIH